MLIAPRSSSRWSASMAFSYFIISASACSHDVVHVCVSPPVSTRQMRMLDIVMSGEPLSHACWPDSAPS